MFSGNIWSINLEEIVKFVELWVMSCLKWNDLKQKGMVSDTSSKFCLGDSVLPRSSHQEALFKGFGIIDG